MTLKDFLKRIDIEKDGDKMLLWCDLEIDIKECDIRLLPSRNNSPFSSEN